jgi:hypothetical protein
MITDLSALGREPKDLRMNGQWFMDLDQYVDVPGFEAIVPHIARGIAMSMQHAEPVVIGSKQAQMDMRIPEVEVVLQEQEADPIIQEMKANGATRQQLYDYVKFAHPSVALGKKILLRTYKNYHAGFAMKHLARVNQDTEAYQYFPELRQWVESCGIFAQFGRIIIFLTERGADAELHCDYADGKTRKDQFLWLNPGRKKKFFVLDTEFKKQYLTGVANTFDSASWHGGDPAETATFTIRIDGLFNAKFLAQSGLLQHFAK